MASPSRNRPRFGPGLLVAAAFIGPGTVVSASKAGAQFGCELLWTILLASVGAIILQTFSARLGITAGQGLGEYVRDSLGSSVGFRLTAVLIIAALGIGNAAYQAGNLTGAAAGLSSVFSGATHWWVVVLAVGTVGVLSVGKYRILQRVLVTLVVLLSLSFLTTSAFSLPSLSRVAEGLLVPRITPESLTLVVALIGTTIVPYNLFLHASSAAENWRSVGVPQALRESRWDTTLSISLGGLVTASILITASTAFFDQDRTLESTADISHQLRPVLGNISGVAFAIGLFAAGLTSSITAPLATGYALCGVLGWPSDIRDWRFRSIAFSVVIAGVLFTTVLRDSAAQTILFAQVANGLLLPFIATLLLVAATRQTTRRAPLWILGAGWIVVGVVTTLAGWKIYQVLV